MKLVSCKLTLCCAAAVGLASSELIAQESEVMAGVETIVVTARKVDESLDDVPSSVSVLGGADSEILVLDGVADFVHQIPNATLVSAGPEYLSDISIRGQGGGRQGFSESATGIYRNGIYVAGGGFGGRSFDRLDLFDIARVETYRGPQGALYGRNAVGGAINVINKRPDYDVTSAEFKLGYETYDRRSASAIFNTPLAEQTALRVGVFAVDQSGGAVNSATTGESLDQKEYMGVRGQLSHQFTESTSANFTLEHYDSTAPGFGVLGRRFEGRVVGPMTGDSENDPFISYDSRIGKVDIDTTSAFVEVDSDMSIGNVTATFMYKQRNGNRYDEDLDMFLGFQGVNLGGVETDLITGQAEDYERVGAEIRLASNLDAAMSWLVGVDLGSHTDDVVANNGGVSGIPALASLATRSDTFTEDLTSFSMFGLVDFSLNEKTTLTLEARVQEDQKEFYFRRVENGLTALDTGLVEQTATKFLPTATLSRTVFNDQVVFLRAASGYRPGGFNTGIDSADAQYIPYDPETAYSMELGWKGVTGGGVRFGVNGFYVVTEDVQASSTLSEASSTTALQNVGDTGIFGLEAEVSGVFPLGEGRIRWGLNVARTDGDFSDGSFILTSGGGGSGQAVERVDLSGIRVNRTRDYVFAANAFYTRPLTQSLGWFAGGSVQAEGGGFENAPGGTSSSTGRDLEDFAMFDARLGVYGDRWQLSIYGKNLTDEIYRAQSVNDNGFYNEPRQYGIELRFDYGE